MQLAHEFLRLPLRFETQRLIDEVAQFGEAEWRPHPQGHAGNSALPLVAANGDPANEDTRGPMLPTPHLARAPYIRQALAALGAPIGRTRLMRIQGRGEATAHVDTNYYWAQRVRVHIPVLTYPGVRFLCGDREVFMGAGECWIFDTWRSHNVLNPDDRPRIHLVVDTVGSDCFWELVAGAEQPLEPGSRPGSPPRLVGFDRLADAPLDTERHNFPAVMTPWEAGWLLERIRAGVPPASERDEQAAAALDACAGQFLQRWGALWARFGADADGRAGYQAELGRLEAELAPLRGRLHLANGVDPATAIQQWVVRAALAPAGGVTAPPAPRPTTAARSASVERPLFIVAAPRSGSTLLFETLARSPDAYTVGGESHALFESIPELAPAARGHESNRLTAADATAGAVARLRQGFAAQLRDREGRRPAPGAAVRLLEKTPKNALRIPFLAAAFPDARFIFLYREPHENMASIIEAWASGRFVTYPDLPGWEGPPWSMLLIPGWRELRGRGPAEVALAQWRRANDQIMDDLAALPPDRWCAASYAELLAEPQATAERLCAFAGLGWDVQLAGPLPAASSTLTPPDPEKWRRHAAAIEPLLPAARATVARAHDALGAARAVGAPRAGTRTQPAPAAGGVSPLRSVHTTSFAQILQELGVSVMASTYQAGKLVLLRARDRVLNTHFRSFGKPMGMALRGGRLAVGTELEIREFADVPAAAHRLERGAPHDACFLPRATHTTGDIQVHELAYAGDELWFVNTRFSCLCTARADVSFVPRWRPPFVSALAPEDRCHLNGLAVVDGRPRFVTALGRSDERQGWRSQKRDGGVLIDVDSGEVVAGGLAMPHSPRWHDGRLWVLNSGSGSIGTVDERSGRYEEVARMPGFTRGLDFYGRYAFVGLSQVRESAVFSGIVVADMPVAERACGVWVIDTRSGRTVAFVRFEDAVQEVFAVQVVPGVRFPELLTDEKELIASTYVLPEASLGEVPASLRS